MFRTNKTSMVSSMDMRGTVLSTPLADEVRTKQISRMWAQQSPMKVVAVDAGFTSDRLATGNNGGRLATDETKGLYIDSDFEEVRRSTMVAIQKSPTPVKVTFKDLTYTIRIKNSRSEKAIHGTKYREEQILKGVSGYALPG